MKKPKVVVIGGGTGTFVTLSGLKNYPLQLAAVVTMMDSGGSTGRLRDQLGVLPTGDVRQALVALSESEEIWRKLFTYRFDSGDLAGHNFGNIFLSALQKITGSTQQAVGHATKLLQAKGEVIPVTLGSASLCAKYVDGSLLIGESLIDSTDTQRPKINYMFVEPAVDVNPKAKAKISQADYIVFGPGDLYTSIVPNLLVDGVVEAINNSSAKKVFVLNMMTKIGQTQGFKASDFVNELQRYLGSAHFDYVIVNNKLPDKKLLEWYKKTAEADFIVDDLTSSLLPNTKIIREDLLCKTKYEQAISDRVKRSLIRHDSDKLAKTLVRIFLG